MSKLPGWVQNLIGVLVCLVIVAGLVVFVSWIIDQDNKDYDADKARFSKLCKDLDAKAVYRDYNWLCVGGGKVKFKEER